MSIETALLGALGALVNGVLVIIMRGVRSELRLIRSDLSGEHRILAEHVNGHVEQRLKQLERIEADHETRLRTAEGAIAQLPRRKTDQGG